MCVHQWNAIYTMHARVNNWKHKLLMQLSHRAAHVLAILHAWLQALPAMQAASGKRAVTCGSR
jgi:hypothetical protein